MRILIVEDEHRIANTIKKGLEQKRYAVDVAYDGTGGFDLASTEEYDDKVNLIVNSITNASRNRF
jgi:DNA-binding response OmpR family regulator